MKRTHQSIVLAALCACLGAASAPGANILWVSDAPPGSGTGGVFSPAGSGYTDSGFVTLLQNAGHNVNRFNNADGQAVLLTAAELAAINTNDLVIIGRGSGSGAFQVGAGTGGGPGQGSNWNAQVTAPLICMSPYLIRTIAACRMGWFQGDVGPDDVPTPMIAANPGNPVVDFIFGGTPMIGANTASPYDETIDRNTSHILGAVVNGGIVYARANFIREDNGAAASGATIAGWPAGTPVAGGSNILAGYRMYFAGGSRESAAVPNGIPLYTGRENLTPAGESIFLRSVQIALRNGQPPPMNPGDPIAVVTPPASRTVGQGRAVTFFIAVAGAAPRTIQWQRDDGAGGFTNVPGAGTTFAQSSLTLPVVGLEDNGAKFRVVAQNPNNTVTTGEVTLTVNPDLEGPIPVSVASLDGTSLVVCFNELVDNGPNNNTVDPFSYSIDGNAIMLNGDPVIRADGRSVTLTPMTPVGPAFTLNVSSIADRFGNVMLAPVDLNGTTLGLTSLSVGAQNPAGNAYACAPNTIVVSGGGLDVAGTADTFQLVSKTVTGDFDARVRVSSLVGTNDHLETTTKALLVARGSTSADANAVSVYVTPTTPGDNTVGVTVRTNAAGATGNLGATVRPNGLPNSWLRIQRVGGVFTAYRSLDGSTWVTLGGIALTNGPSMVVGLGVSSHRNGKLATATFTDFGFASPPVIAGPPASLTVAQGDPAGFGVEAIGEALTYQWRRNGTNIPGATDSFYAIVSAQPADAGGYSVVVANGAGSVTSPTATLKVTASVAALALPPSGIPDGTYAQATLPGPGVITLSPGTDPVVGISIAPPTTLLAADAYVAGVDYAACYGPLSGGAVVNFNAIGSYVLRVTRGSGATTLQIVNVGAKSLDTCASSGELKEFPCPTPPKAFEGDDADDPPDFANQCTVTGITNLVQQVCDTAGAGMIDLVLVDHGSEGSISINGQRVSCAAADAGNLEKFCALKGKVKSVTLLSCSTGRGAAGREFLLKLSKKLGAIPVTGYTGPVVSFDRNGKRLWGSYGVPTTQKNAVLSTAENAGNTLKISWEGGGVLESADDVTGPWTPVEGATSPHVVNKNAAKKFYRVRQ